MLNKEHKAVKEKKLVTNNTKAFSLLRPNNLSIIGMRIGLIAYFLKKNTYYLINKIKI